MKTLLNFGILLEDVNSLPTKLDNYLSDQHLKMKRRITLFRSMRPIDNMEEVIWADYTNGSYAKHHDIIVEVYLRIIMLGRLILYRLIPSMVRNIFGMLNHYYFLVVWIKIIQFMNLHWFLGKD